jgi:hypothetical protein
MEICGRLVRLIPQAAWAHGSLICDDQDPITVTGRCIRELAVGSNVVLLGEFVEHPRYGRQFRADAAERIPGDRAELLAALQSSFHGCGAKTASTLVESHAAVYGGLNRLLTDLALRPWKLEAVAAALGRRITYLDPSGSSALNVLIEKLREMPTLAAAGAMGLRRLAEWLLDDPSGPRPRSIGDALAELARDSSAAARVAGVPLHAVEEAVEKPVAEADVVALCKRTGHTFLPARRVSVAWNAESRVAAARGDDPARRRVAGAFAFPASGAPPQSALRTPAISCQKRFCDTIGAPGPLRGERDAGFHGAARPIGTPNEAGRPVMVTPRASGAQIEPQKRFYGEIRADGAKGRGPAGGDVMPPWLAPQPPIASQKRFCDPNCVDGEPGLGAMRERKVPGDGRPAWAVEGGRVYPARTLAAEVGLARRLRGLLLGGGAGAGNGGQPTLTLLCASDWTTRDRQLERVAEHDGSTVVVSSLRTSAALDLAATLGLRCVSDAASAMRNGGDAPGLLASTGHVLVVDAESLDVVLADSILDRVPPRASISLQGDPLTLLPLGQGQPFLDLLGRSGPSHGALNPQDGARVSRTVVPALTGVPESHRASYGSKLRQLWLERRAKAGADGVAILVGYRHASADHRWTVERAHVAMAGVVNGGPAPIVRTVRESQGQRFREVIAVVGDASDSLLTARTLHTAAAVADSAAWVLGDPDELSLVEHRWPPLRNSALVERLSLPHH